MTLAKIAAPTFPAQTPTNDPRLRAWKSAQEFEGQFLKTMLEQAFAGTQGEGPLGASGPGADAWRGMLLDQHAKTMSARGALGIAPLVYRDIVRSIVKTPAAGGLDARA